MNVDLESVDRIEIVPEDRAVDTYGAYQFGRHIADDGGACLVEFEGERVLIIWEHLMGDAGRR